MSASRPTVVLSGALAVVPDYSLDDVEAGLAPEPDVVVVPAVAALLGLTATAALGVALLPAAAIRRRRR